VHAQTAFPPPDPVSLEVLEPVSMTGTLFQPIERDPSETLIELSHDELLLSGDQTPIETLRMQPAFFGAMNTANDSNSGSGSSSPNIRAIGTLRTLTLINGRRAGGGSAFGLEPGGFANLELVPQAAIEQIDILLETASTTYGSDAIAGVVNLQLADRFEGVRVDGLYGDTTSGGGQTQQYSLIGGFALDEDTRLTLLATYFDQQVIWARDRALSATTNFIPRGGTNRGSSSFPGRAVFTTGGTTTNGVLAPGIDTPASAADYQPYQQATDAFNYNAFAPDIPAMTVASGYGALEHILSPQVVLYGDFLYSFQDQANGLAPAPWIASPGSDLFTAIAGSPHNPFAPGELNEVRYRNFELGNLTVDNQRNAFRLVGGAQGLIDDRWEWDTALLYTQSNLNQSLTGIADARRLIPFVNAGTFNPFSRAVSGTNAGIAFDNYGALQSSQIKATNTYFENLFSYDATVSGRLARLPAGGLNGAAGLEYRRETIDTTPSAIWGARQNLGGTGFSRPFSGQRDVFSLFGELFTPLVSQSQDIPGVRRLDLTLGFRWETYADEGDDPVTTRPAANGYGNVSWKAALSWEPVETVTLRAAYSTGFRAPTLFESYASDLIDFPILVDPTGATPPGAPIPTLIRGNPSLDPETSQSVSASGTWKPAFASGVTLRVDYYFTEVRNAIANGAQFIVNRNLPSEVIRAPGGGSILFVNSRVFNASELTTQGLDYRVDYAVDLTGDASLELSAGANQTLSYEARVPGAGTLDFAGRYVDKRSNNLSPGAVPQWKGLASAFLQWRRVDLGVTTEYISSYEDDANFTLGGAGRTVGAYARVNLVARVTVEDSACRPLNGTTFTVGVDNVFDESPPFAAGAFADGYDTSLYSIANRFVYGAVSKSF